MTCDLCRVVARGLPGSCRPGATQLLSGFCPGGRQGPGVEGAPWRGGGGTGRGGCGGSGAAEAGSAGKDGWTCAGVSQLEDWFYGVCISSETGYVYWFGFWGGEGPEVGIHCRRLGSGFF